MVRTTWCRRTLAWPCRRTVVVGLPSAPERKERREHGHVRRGGPCPGCCAVLRASCSRPVSPSSARCPPMRRIPRTATCASGGGATHNEGRLEIFHDDEWGTVCDDFFGRRDAKVACKQMDYTGAEAYLTDVAVAPGRRFWLDDVNCMGNEARLTECFYNSDVRNSSSRTSPQWGIANCIPSEQVGVRCTASRHGPRAWSSTREPPHGAGAGPATRPTRSVWAGRRPGT